MKDVYVVGIDPGFASCGVAVVKLGPAEESIVFMDTITTEKVDKKKGVRDSDDNTRRAIRIARELRNFIPEGTVAICAEAQSWVRYSGSAIKMGIAWGVISTVAAFREIPILHASPKEIKKCLCGRGTASKKEVQAALARRYGELPLPKQKGKHEHACDALGAVVTCLDAPAIMTARRMIA